MDLAYWGFRRWPFERSFAADRFFAGSLHEEALARLLFLVEEHRRSGILTGPAGTGKTFLLKLLQQRAQRLGRLAIRCDAMGLEGNELASQIAIGCHVPCDPDATSTQIWSGLSSRFTASAMIRQPVVVIIDHFDHIDMSCQKAVCRLHQLADTVQLKLTVILASRDPNVPVMLQDFVDLRIDIAPWTAAECSQFISRSIADAGSSKVLFTDDALSSLFELSSGVPNKIIALCGVSLLATMEREETLVTQEIVELVAREWSLRIGDQIARSRLASEHQMVAGLTW